MTAILLPALEAMLDAIVANEGEPDAGPARFAVLPELSDDRLLGDAVDLADLTGCDDVGLIGFCMGTVAVISTYAPSAGNG